MTNNYRTRRNSQHHLLIKLFLIKYFKNSCLNIQSIALSPSPLCCSYPIAVFEFSDILFFFPFFFPSEVIFCFPGIKAHPRRDTRYGVSGSPGLAAHLNATAMEWRNYFTQISNSFDSPPYSFDKPTILRSHISKVKPPPTCVFIEGLVRGPRARKGWSDGPPAREASHEPSPNLSLAVDWAPTHTRVQARGRWAVRGSRDGGGVGEGREASVRWELDSRRSPRVLQSRRDRPVQNKSLK